MSQDISGGKGPTPTASQRVDGRGGVGVAARGTGLRGWARQAFQADPETILFAARVSVWLRWFVFLVAVVELAYRPGFWLDTQREFAFLLAPLVVFNGFVHYRLHRTRTIAWGWLLALSAMDIILITAGVIIGGDFHHFGYVTYFAALALFAGVFASLRVCLLWTTAVATTYSIVSIVSLGLDVEAGQEKALFARVAAMYGIVLCVSLIARFERARQRESAARERELHRDRIELSHAIHDTAAQNAYMVSMGIHRAVRMVDDSDEELKSTLAATSTLSKAAAWELRRPIDEGRLFEGRELGRVLWSHAGTFEQIASVPTEVIQTGAEPSLPLHTRACLFSITHNALTNAFLHAQATRVEVRLDFGDEGLRLSVSDDGVGLPHDYAERGRGFLGMRTEAERLGGRLIVESAGPGQGTTVICETPYG